VFVEAGAGVAPGEACTLLVETLEERRRFAVLQGRRGPVVRLTRSLLEGLGVPTGESAVVELEVRKDRDATTRKVFSRWDPLLGFMELPLGGAGFEVGDALEVVGGRRYDVWAFVEDFVARRLGELANVELELEGGSLTAVVDGKSVPVEEHWLATHGLKAVLKVKLGYDYRLVKFVFDGTYVEARFDNSDPILEFNAVGSGLDVRYSRTAGQAYVMRLQERPPQGNVEYLGWLVGGIRVIQRPMAPQGAYRLEMSDLVREKTKQMLNESTDETYPRLRGDVGEGIVKMLWQDMRMKLLYDHPWSKPSTRQGSLRRGPDFMVKSLDSDIVGYVEVKWHEDVVRAFGEAKDKVLEHFQLKPNWNGENITAAYIAILDWKVTRAARLWVERVA
jgi:hypothetical protein